MNDPSLLFHTQEASSVREVLKNEEGTDSYNDCQKTLKDEDPLPTCEASNAVHFGNCIGKKSGESSSHTGSTEEEALAKCKLFRAIPHCEIVGDTGVKTSFGYTKEDSGNQKSMVALDKSHERHDCAPCNHDAWQPDRGSEAFEEEIGRDLEGAIGEEKDSCTQVVLGTGEVEVGLETLNFGVPDVASVEEGE